MSVNRGDVVIVDFPFPDATGSKVRPALVVQSDRNNVRIANTVVAMITRRTHKASSEPTQVLVDPQFFRQVELGERGRYIEWPGHLDFCADALWEQGQHFAPAVNSGIAVAGPDS